MNPHFNCKKINRTPGEITTNLPQEYNETHSLELRQFWLSPEAMPVEKATMHLGYTNEGLCFFVILEDKDIFTKASKDQEKLWSLGDTVEFFVKPGTVSYYETHVSPPNNLFMDLKIGDRENIGTWDELLDYNSQNVHNICVDRKNNKWAVELFIPWMGLERDTPPSSEEIWSIAVCRYNYTQGEEKPELSSTALFSKKYFHLFEDYHSINFE